MTQDREGVPCYIGRCPLCQGVVMIAVADPSNPSTMRMALKERASCERMGYLVETLPVAEGRQAIQAQWDHAAGCLKDRRAKSKAKRAAREARENVSQSDLLAAGTPEA